MPAITLEMTPDDVRMLSDLSHVYSHFGPVRALIRLMSRGETRARFRFVDQESDVLRRFMEATLASMGDQPREVRFTVRALVAFWGRALTSAHPRRRPKPDVLERREALAAVLESGARRLQKSERDALEREIASRRPIEQDWMRERLGL